MIGGGQPVELAVELLRWVPPQACMLWRLPAAINPAGGAAGVELLGWAGPQACMVCSCGWAVDTAGLVQGSAA